MAIKGAKTVKELLQEHQEPFILEVYLVERGYFSSCHRNSLVPTKGSSGCVLNKSKKGISLNSKLLRVVHQLFVSVTNRLRFNTSRCRHRKLHVTWKIGDNQQAEGLVRFSSASSTTVLTSYSESAAEETSTLSRKDCAANTQESSHLSNPTVQEVSEETEILCPSTENSKQDSPVSVLDNKPSHRRSPPHNKDFATSKEEEENGLETGVILPKKVITEDSILSASLWKILFHSVFEKPICGGATEIREHVHFKSKIVLQKTKQLLFDCVREIVLTQRRKEVQQQHQYFGSQELGELIGDKIKAWVKQSGDESNLTKLLELDLVVSAPEWGDYKTYRKDIGSKIADAILEDTKNEIVVDMINLMLSLGC